MFTFHVFGIPVTVHPFFWLTLGLIGGGLRADDTTSVLLVLMFIAAGFVSILIHELGHALTIRRFGLPTQIQLIAFGGYAAYPAGQLNRKQSFLVTAAGPALQFALGTIVIILLQIIPVPQGSLLREFMRDIVIVSILWSVLNCIPIFPLDGGQMLSAILGPKREPTTYLIGTILAATIGIIAFLYLGDLLLIAFMAFFTWQNWQRYQAVKS